VRKNSDKIFHNVDIIAGKKPCIIVCNCCIKNVLTDNCCPFAGFDPAIKMIKNKLLRWCLVMYVIYLNRNHVTTVLRRDWLLSIQCRSLRLVSQQQGSHASWKVLHFFCKFQDLDRKSWKNTLAFSSGSNGKHAAIV